MAKIKSLFPSRFALLKSFIILFLVLSLVVRNIFLIWNFSEVDKGPFALIKIFFSGLFFDIGTISFFGAVAALYFLLLPKRFYGSLVDRIICYAGFILNVLIIYFSFFAEVTFWDEFHRRFNFIAVDYLIYTYEVVKNINESYPLPLLLGGMAVLVGLTAFLFKHYGIFKRTFDSKSTFRQKLAPTLTFVGIVIIFSLFVKSEAAETSKNRYNNELSKSGIYSFFAAFRNNELSYTEFYKTTDIDSAFAAVKKKITLPTDTLVTHGKSIERFVSNGDGQSRPNVIFICVESLSAYFLGSYGDDRHLTPSLDSLAYAGIRFSNLFATGTRTVRGMEAITLSIPPTPGRSIVKRENNLGLFTIGEVFKEKGYSRTFFYGGDSYFDNMGKYFSGNGFDIVDRGRGFLPSGDIVTHRQNIEDDEVTFENAWGVCDEDIYAKVIKEANIKATSGKPFFNFIMTTSNHKPYTYPDNKVDVPSGTGRDGAVKYTDFAIQKFMDTAKTRPWFQNTVFVIMADHCASSAGKWELDVANYHIPALIINLKGGEGQTVDKLCSQIDIFPTLFGMLHWDYKSKLFGLDVQKMKPSDGRAFIGNYRKLGFLKDNKVIVLGDGKKADFYSWDPLDNNLKPLPMDNRFLEETISFYQVADYLYNHAGLKLKK